MRVAKISAWITLKGYQMGDRTSVVLSVPDQFKEVIEGFGNFDDTWEGAINTQCFQYYEVNYGELDFLKKLEAKGIAYENEWAAGGEYTAGTKSCRFTAEGIIDIKEIYDIDRNPSIDKLMDLIKSPDKLIKFIQIHHEKISVLPWDNQVEYGKLYLARKLIEPNP